MAALGLSAYKARIDGELERRLDELFGALPEPQREALRQALAGGRRLRGSLACLVAEALGAQAGQALAGALAVEMIQAASLVHDDYVDGDTMRRGRPAAWTTLSPQRAVLLGDLIFATAIGHAARLGVRECETVARAIAAMAEGALLETLAPESYGQIIALKTGALFAAAARLGALAAHAPEALVEAAAQFGARAGEAYQIADDLTDEAHAGPQRRRLEAELERRAEEAREALRGFPANGCTAALAAWPLTFAPKRSPIRTR